MKSVINTIARPNNASLNNRFGAQVQGESITGLDMIGV